MSNSEPAALYFHGLPGSARDLHMFGEGVAEQAGYLHVIERGPEIPAEAPEGYFARLAARIERDFSARPLRLTGFSLGAATALRVAPHLGDRVEQIDLVSPAGPLSAGNFLPQMAGEPVFRAAMAGSLRLAAVTWVQAQAARSMPQRMARMLMAKAQGADRELAREEAFIENLAASLRYSLLHARSAYRREIELYVEDWQGLLSQVGQPVTIHQGDADDWTPPEMARALANSLGNLQGLHIHPGLSHFSTLRAYLAFFSAKPAERP